MDGTIIQTIVLEKVGHALHCVPCRTELVLCLTITSLVYSVHRDRAFTPLLFNEFSLSAAQDAFRLESTTQLQFSKQRYINVLKVQ